MDVEKVINYAMPIFLALYPVAIVLVIWRGSWYISEKRSAKTDGA